MRRRMHGVEDQTLLVRLASVYPCGGTRMKVARRCHTHVQLQAATLLNATGHRDSHGLTSKWRSTVSSPNTVPSGIVAKKV